MSLLPQLTTAEDAKPPPQPRKSQARTIGIASIIWASSIFLSRIMGLLASRSSAELLVPVERPTFISRASHYPDFLNYLLAAGALSIVFIPIFVEYLERNDRDGGWKALSVIANFIFVVGSIGIVLLMVFARPLASFVAPGINGPGEVELLVG